MSNSNLSHELKTRESSKIPFRPKSTLNSTSARNNLGGSIVTASATQSLPLKFREYFHYFLNIESHPEMLVEARRLADACFADARIYMTKDDPISEFPSVCTFFEFTHERFKQRMVEIWQELMAIVLTKWLADGAPNKWYCKTKEHFVDFIVNESPFHLTDGAWLRGSIPMGTITPADAALFTVFMDEMGNGNVSMNHCNVYNDVLKSVGVYMPHVTSRAFIEQTSIVDGAFANPTFPLAVSLFPRTYFPEILGMTLWLELSSASLHAPQAKILERYKLSPLFSRLHTAIDNPTAGHSFLAKEAIHWYMDDLKAREGEDVANAHWIRIWTGFVAFAITGGYKHELEAKWAESDSKLKTPVLSA
jgi:hypothetical protein